MAAKAECLDSRSVYLGGSLPNVILDFALVAMPLPYVWRLHAPLAQRVILAGMFALGFFICIVSIVRLTITMNIVGSKDTTYDLKDFIMWSVVEINIGLVCSCLPSMRPLLRAIGLSRLFSSIRSHGTPATPATPGVSNNYNQSHNNPSRVSRSRKKGSTGGLFSTIAGLTRNNSEEDGFQMIGHGKSDTEIEVGKARSDIDNSSNRTQERNPGITMQRDWSVLVDEQQQGRR